MLRSLVATAVLMVTSACGDWLVCVGRGVSIEIEVRVVGTLEPAASGTLGVAIDGDFVDTLRTDPAVDGSSKPVRLYSRVSRPATYEVRLQRDGFHEWVARDVVVGGISGCGGTVEAATLTALLRPRSSKPD